MSSTPTLTGRTAATSDTNIADRLGSKTDVAWTEPPKHDLVNVDVDPTPPYPVESVASAEPGESDAAFVERVDHLELCQIGEQPITGGLSLHDVDRLITLAEEALAHRGATPTAPAPRDNISFQARVQPWLMACFGPEISGDREERNHRFLEEALELVQACGCTASEAHQLVDYVYGREVGDPRQETGGVMVTLAALCLANGLDMHEAAEVELARVWTKVEKIRAKQAAKPKHSPLPEAPAPRDGGNCWEWRWTYDLSSSGWTGSFGSEASAFAAAAKSPHFQPHFKIEVRRATPAPTSAPGQDAGPVDAAGVAGRQYRPQTEWARREVEWRTCLVDESFYRERGFQIRSTPADELKKPRLGHNLEPQDYTLNAGPAVTEAVAAEREACALIADDLAGATDDPNVGGCEWPNCNCNTVRTPDAGPAVTEAEIHEACGAFVISRDITSSDIRHIRVHMRLALEAAAHARRTPDAGKAVER